MTRNPIIVALDVPALDDARRLVAELHPHVAMFKVGLELCTAEGLPRVLDALHGEGGQLFVDLKFKDIPNTVAGAVRGLNSPAVRMFNVHCDGGSRMLQAAAQTAQSLPHRPLALGVTVLTSVDEATLHEEMRVAEPMHSYVTHLALLARAAGLQGVVCSAHEAAAIKAACGADFVTVVPGVRPAWAATDDQARVMMPAEAVHNGADFLVIGRPITRPPAGIGSPAEAAQRILEELA